MKPRHRSSWVSRVDRRWTAQARHDKYLGRMVYDLRYAELPEVVATFYVKDEQGTLANRVADLLENQEKRR